MREGAIVSLSGGMDSCTALGWAVDRFEAKNVKTIAFYYGQKHAAELRAAELVAQHYGVPFEIIKLPQIFSGAGSTLIDAGAEIQEMASYEELEKKFGSQPTVVPNRNMNFIAMAITYAWTHGLNHVVLGVHAGDAGHFHYPDCRPAFIGAMNAAAEIASEGMVDIIAPFNHMSKGQIVELATMLDGPIAPLWLTQSCYQGERPACGACATCHERIGAFREANLVDPIPYKIAIDWGDASQMYNIVKEHYPKPEGWPV